MSRPSGSPRLPPLIRLLVYVPIAFLVAVLAAALLIALALFGIGGSHPDFAVYLVVAILLLAINAGIVAFIPALLAIVVAEFFGWRSVLYYLAIGMLIGVVGDYIAEPYLWLGFIERRLSLLVSAGFIGGFVYWRLAGHQAGSWRQMPPLPGAGGSGQALAG